MDIVSKRTRRTFAEYLTAFSWLNQIRAYFYDGDVEYIELEENERQSGERRSLTYGYYKSVNWGDFADVSKVISVYETILNDVGENNEYAKQHKERLLSFLKMDGFHFENGRLIHKPSISVPNKSVLQATKTADINLYIQRIESSINSDPDLAIGNSKELIETICKNILDDIGVSYSNSSKLPQLMKSVAKELKLTPENIKDSVKGADTIKRILSNLSTIVNGIAELRNLYGTGHGKGKSYRGLSPRHARLVVGASSVLASFLIETYELQKEEIHEQ